MWAKARPNANVQLEIMVIDKVLLVMKYLIRKLSP